MEERLIAYLEKVWNEYTEYKEYVKLISKPVDELRKEVAKKITEATSEEDITDIYFNSVEKVMLHNGDFINQQNRLFYTVEAYKNIIEIPQEIKDLIIDLFINEGVSFKDIGAQTGILPAKVSALIKEWGIEDPRKIILAKFETKDSDKDRGVLAAQIYKKYPEYEFWQIMRLPFQLNSLKWMLGEDGEEYINQYIQEFKTPQPEKVEVKMAAEKIGEDYIVTKKLTRKDFLK